MWALMTYPLRNLGSDHLLGSFHKTPFFDNCVLLSFLRLYPEAHMVKAKLPRFSISYWTKNSYDGIKFEYMELLY